MGADSAVSWGMTWFPHRMSALHVPWTSIPHAPTPVLENCCSTWACLKVSQWEAFCVRCGEETKKKTRKATQNLRSKTTCALKQHDEETVPAAQQRDMGMAVQQTAQAQTMAYQRRVPDFQKETYLTRVRYANGYHISMLMLQWPSGYSGSISAQTNASVCSVVPQVE